MLIRSCQSALVEAEQKVQLLVQNGLTQDLVDFDQKDAPESS
jgi:exonuclease VII small subunit